MCLTVPDRLLGPLSDDLGLHEESEGSHDSEREMAATSIGSAKEEQQYALFKNHTEKQSAVHYTSTVFSTQNMR